MDDERDPLLPHLALANFFALARAWLRQNEECLIPGLDRRLPLAWGPEGEGDPFSKKALSVSSALFSLWCCGKGTS